MKPARFEYIRAQSVTHALSELDDQTSDARILAGGQSLIPAMNLRLAQPQRLVDVSQLQELRAVVEQASTILVGGGVTHAMFEDRMVPEASNGLLSEMTASIGYRAIRNRGTIGGSLAHADPAAEWPVALMALDAEVNLRSPTDQRCMSIEDLIVGVFDTAVAHNEIIESVSIPRLNSNVRWGFEKTCRKVGEFAVSFSVAIVNRTDSAAKIAIGGLSAPPIILSRSSVALGECVFRGPCLAAHHMRSAIEADLADANGIDSKTRLGVHVATAFRAAMKALAT